MAVLSQLSPYNIQARLDTLVDDVLIQIISLLPAWDVLHLRQASKRLEALSHVRAVWRALFERDVLTCRRPIPGLSFTPTPRLLQLCALDASTEDLDRQEFCDDKYNVTRQLIEASDLEARTLHALRLDRSWNGSAMSIATSVPTPDVSDSDAIGTSESRLRKFQTPSPVFDIFLFPGGRFVVSLHADRLRCWDLGVPHASRSGKVQVAGVRCAGEVVFSHVLPNATMCMDTRPGASSVTVSGRHKEYSISFALIPDVVPSWHSDDPSGAKSQKRSCEILSVRLDPLRSSPFASFESHDTASGSVSGSPFATPVPVFLREAVVSLPDILPTPSYPEGSISAQTMVGEQWGPHRFSRGKLGKLLLVYGSLMFFESFVPPEPAEGEEEEEERPPKYAGIEVLDWNEPTNTVLFEYPDPQVGPYVGLHVHASADQVLVVWQNCAGLFSLPFLSLNSSSASRSGSASGSSSPRSSRPPTPSRASSASKYSSSPLLSTSPLSSSPGSPRLSLNGSVLDLRIDEDVKIAGSDPDTSGLLAEPEREAKRTVTMPNVIFALSEAVEAPIAFSLCDVDVSGSEFADAGSNEQEPGVPHPLTIIARSRTNPNRNVQSVMTASPNPRASSPDEKFTFRLSRIPTSTENDAEATAVAALAIGSSGRGVRADANGTLLRCTRSEVVLPKFGFGFGGFGFGFGGVTQASAVPTVDFWPWRCAGVLPPSSVIGEDSESHLALRFDDGMGRVVTVRVPRSSSGPDDIKSSGTSEVTVLDFA